MAKRPEEALAMALEKKFLQQRALAKSWIRLKKIEKKSTLIFYRF
jgi:hypothetical protein